MRSESGHIVKHWTSYGETVITGPVQGRTLVFAAASVDYFPMHILREVWPSMSLSYS